MTDDHTLADAFAELERDAPDADIEFAALTARLDGLGRRRTRRTALGGLTVAGLAAAVALGATYLPGDPAPRPAGVAAPRPNDSPTVVPVPQPNVRQVAFSKDVPTTTGTDGIERPVVAVDADWLPAGASLNTVDADTSRSDGGSDRRWLVPYPHGGLGGYYVSVGRSGENHLPAQVYFDTSGKDVTVQGRPARLFDVHWGVAVHELTLAVDYGQGRVYQTDLHYETAKLSFAAALDVTEHVAREMRVGLRDPLPVTARLTAAPRGAQIVDAYAVFDDSVYKDHFTMTSYRLDDEDDGAQIGIGGLAEKYPAPISKGVAGRPVQGKRSVVIKDEGQTVLYVKGLFGEYTKLITGKGAETLADLYQIADGIRAVK